MEDKKLNCNLADKHNLEKDFTGAMGVMERLNRTIICTVITGCIMAGCSSHPALPASSSSTRPVRPRPIRKVTPPKTTPVKTDKSDAKSTAPAKNTGKSSKPATNNSNIANPNFPLDGNVKTVQKKSSGTATRFQGYSWFVTELYGAATFVYKEAPWISFTYSGKAEGSSGCYLLQGFYIFKPDNQLKVNVRSGRESCKTGDEQTMKMLKALMETRSFTIIDKKELVLSNGTNQPVLKAVIKY